MESPLSPIIADLVMQNLEKKDIESIGLELPFYYRYVDDIILSAPNEQVNNILNNFNNIHERLRFTIELKKYRSINFLDISLILINNMIVVD